MSFHEKRSILSIISNTLVFVIYAFIVYNRYQGMNFSQESQVFYFWAKAFLILIPITIVTHIVIYIIFHIINSIANKETDPEITDERDKLIELKSLRISHYVFILGFVLAMVSQVIKMPPTAMFVTLFISGFISSVVSEIA